MEATDALFLEALGNEILPTAMTEIKQVVESVFSGVRQLKQASKELPGKHIIDALSHTIDDHFTQLPLFSPDGDTVPALLEKFMYLCDAWTELAATLQMIIRAVDMHRARIDSLLRRISVLQGNIDRASRLLRDTEGKSDVTRADHSTKKAQRNHGLRSAKQRKTLEDHEKDLRQTCERSIASRKIPINTLMLANGKPQTVEEAVRAMQESVAAIDPVHAQVLEFQVLYADLYRRCIDRAEAQERKEEERRTQQVADQALRAREQMRMKLRTSIEGCSAEDLLLVQQVCQNMAAILKREFEKGNTKMTPQSLMALLQDHYMALRQKPGHLQRKVAIGKESDALFLMCDYDAACDFLDGLEQETIECRLAVLRQMGPAYRRYPNSDITKDMAELSLELQRCSFLRESINIKRKVLFLSHPLRWLRRWGRNILNVFKEIWRKAREDAGKS